MNAADIPLLMPKAWAQNAGGTYIRAIPDTTLVPGEASFDQGFPALTFTPPAGGGKLPSGRDFNGAFNIITKWLRWMQAGGAVYFDSAFSTAIGGYPAGARLQSKYVTDLAYVSQVDNNDTDPDGGMAAFWTPVFADMVGATNSVTGIHGLVPAPAAGLQNDYLQGNGTWSFPFTVTNSSGVTVKTWKNGWKEMFGTAFGVGADSSVTITFPGGGFASAPPQGAVQLTVRFTTVNINNDNVAVIQGDPTATQMTIYNNQVNGHAVCDINWRVEGI